VIPQWKRSKGLVNVCSKCNGSFADEEFDFEEDMCMKCLFPQSSVSMPVMYDKSYGDKRNTTIEADILKDLRYRPTKQSKASIKAKREYDWRNYSKKG